MNPELKQKMAELTNPEEKKALLQQVRMMLLKQYGDIKVMADDPYFGKQKMLSKQSEIAVSEHTQATIAITPVQALAELTEALAENLKELDALEAGVMLIV